jgi:YD repeat-containing protein
MRTFPLIFTYNSHTNTWTHTLNVSLTLDATGAAIVRDADGTAHLFRREANGSYTAPAGNYDTLVHHPDQTFTLTHPDQSTHLFDASGRLTQVRDRNGNAINLTYTNNVLTQAQAAGGQTLTFAYSGGNLASVTDHAGRAFQFGYTSGALTSITDPMNLVTRFGYTNNRLTMITDARNTDNNNRLRCVESRPDDHHGGCAHSKFGVRRRHNNVHRCKQQRDGVHPQRYRSGHAGSRCAEWADHLHLRCEL